MIEKINSGVRLHIIAQPNGKKSEILGVYQEMLKIRLKAPPIEGKANEVLIEFLSGIFHVAKNQLRIVRGETSRRKVVEITGMTFDHVNKIVEENLPKTE